MSSPRSVNVNVIYKAGNKPNVELQSDDIPIVDGKLIFKNDGHDGFWVRFNLCPKTLGDYYFPNTKEDALYSAIVHGNEGVCPTSGVWEGFRTQGLDNGNKTLVIRNINGKLPPNKQEQAFSFTLRVNKDKNSNSDFLELDPGGINQNGSTKTTLSTTAALVVGAAAGVLATLSTQALLYG